MSYQNSYSSPVRGNQSGDYPQRLQQSQQQPYSAKQQYPPQQKSQYLPQYGQQSPQQKQGQLYQSGLQSGRENNVGNISPNKNAISRLNGNQVHGDQELLTINPRITYLRKLYFALTVQLILIGSFALLLHLFPEWKEYIEENPIFIWVAIVLTILIALYGLCFRNNLRQSPINIAVLILWTLSFGFTLTYVLSIIGDSEAGIMVFVLLISIVFSQFVYTLTVRYELTIQGSVLYIFGATLLVFHAFTLFSNLSFMVQAAITLFELLFGFYLIYDTQSRIASPDYDYNKEEWISGTVLVYIDVFLLILRIGDLLKTSIHKRED